MSDPAETVLLAAAWHDVPLAQALHAAPAHGVALLATPRRYHVARMDDGAPRLRGNAPVGAQDVFEARIFHEAAELRWLHVADRRGRAVLLTEDPGLLPTTADEQLEPLHAVDTIGGEYLLWGRAAAHRDGWTTLATPRIGTLPVPVTARSGSRVRLLTREYVTCDPEHGNASVAEERLLRLGPVT